METKNDEKYVWYACYGSNLSYERFMRYINKCSDTTPPSKWRPIDIPHNLYFARNSICWGGAVAFINPEINEDAHTLGRAYYISYYQYTQVKGQEGGKYTNEIDLDTFKGIKTVSFTDTEIFPQKQPSQSYSDCITKGLKETYPNMSDAAINDYLQKRIAAN